MIARYTDHAAIDSDEVIRMPRSRAQLLLSTVIAITVTFFWIYLAVLSPSWHVMSKLDRGITWI